METIADRLQKALVDPKTGRKRSMRGLHRRLREAGVFEKAYSSMYAYFTGETEPSMPFLQAAAQELRVSRVWLILGEGPMDATEAAQGDDEQRSRAIMDAAWAAFRAELGELDPAGVFSAKPGFLAALPDVVLWLDRFAPEGVVGRQDSRALWVASAKKLGRATTAPLKALGLDAAAWPEALKASYVAVTLAALQPLLKESFAGSVLAHTRKSKDSKKEADNAQA